MLSSKINKCEVCQGNLLLHHKIIQCLSCEKIIHSKCSSNDFVFNHLENRWQCQTCMSNKTLRYNPFSTLSHNKYDPVDMENIDDLTEISNILQSCGDYDFKTFNALKTNSSTTSVLFNNIDGNATNFDMFESHISRLDHSFSVIGIAETNTPSYLPRLVCRGHIKFWSHIKFCQRLERRARSAQVSGVKLTILDLYLNFW